MNFGQNLYDLFINNAQPIVLVGFGVGGIYLLYKRKLTEFVVLLAVAIVAVGFVFNPTGAKDVLLKIFNGVVVNAATMEGHMSASGITGSSFMLLGHTSVVGITGPSFMLLGL